jgi:short-subunit dehydrogenase
VVNIASMAGKVFSPYLATYSASKHAVVGFTHSLRAECGDDPVGFSAICPIFISRVGMYGRLEGDLPEPPALLRPRPPEEVGEAVVRAIRENRAEIIVGNAAARPLIALSALFPKFMSKLGRNQRPVDFAEQFAAVRDSKPRTAAEQRVEADPIGDPD